MPNIDFIGTGSGVVGDGGSFGLESGEGHKVADVAEEAEATDCPEPCGPFPDSSYGSTTVGSSVWKSSSQLEVISLTLVTKSYLLPN